MGLSAPKNRMRYGADPNNTTWANSTDTFGHKYLTSQGWTPGSALGAMDAGHSEHYTAASMNHIPMTLRGERVGLGCKKMAAVENDKFGLNMFQNLLSRLNGKSEEVIQKEDDARTMVDVKMYHAQKFGNMTFVYGGLLVGEQLKTREVNLADKKRKRDDSDNTESKDKNASSKKSKKSGSSHSDDNERARRKQEKSMKKAAKRLKKEEKSKKKALAKEKSKAKRSSEETDTDPDSASADNSDDDKKKEKSQKSKDKKDKKKSKSKSKSKRRSSSKSSDSNSDSSSDSDSDEKDKENSTKKMAAPTMPMGRFNVRRRYIESKRRAAQDPERLKEIFMITTPA